MSKCSVLFPIQLREEGIKVSYKQSSIYLPPQAFSSSSNSRIVTLVYLTLNDVLPLAPEDGNGDDQALSPNTTIVSAAVDPKPLELLNKPVKIVLQKTKVLFSSFWNFELHFHRTKEVIIFFKDEFFLWRQSTREMCVLATRRVRDLEHQRV